MQKNGKLLRKLIFTDRRMNGWRKNKQNRKTIELLLYKLNSFLIKKTILQMKSKIHFIKKI